ELMCVEHREALRDHDAAITSDGFMTRGAFVERTRHYDNQPFVGQRGLRQQLAWKEKQRDQLLIEDTDALQREWNKRFAASESLAEQLAEARRLPELEAERDRSIARLNTIDRAKFDELAQQQTGLENELRSLAEEQRRLDRSEKRADTRRLEKAVAERAAAEREILDRFQHVQSETDVSVWLPRLRELREEVCARWPAKDVGEALSHAGP
ncbi:MAG: hypothetical protein WBW78_13330, partial [Terrimicrobiaceae bacterium]